MGMSGVRGLSGPKGDVVVDGKAGSKGHVGKDGRKGERGVDGFTGKSGDKGDKGEVGVRGMKGIQGQVGENGRDGKDGATGIQGQAGPTGRKGEIGVRGSMGITGEKGDMGQKGEHGAKGLTGDKGKQGVTGLTGARGGVGENGVQGFRGVKGEKGLKGERGVRCLKGVIGETGVKGNIGVKGMTGQMGAKGITGSTTGRKQRIIFNKYNINKNHNHTKPALVAFSVGSSKPFMSTTWARVPMQENIYNPAGYYRNGAFYAPVKGVYSFHFGGLSAHGKNADLHLYTQKAGGAKVHVARAYGSSRSWSGTAASVIVEMEVGETASVWFWGRGNSGLGLFGAANPSGPTTLFSGKLEQKLD